MPRRWRDPWVRALTAAAQPPPTRGSRGEARGSQGSSCAGTWEGGSTNQDRSNPIKWRNADYEKEWNLLRNTHGGSFISEGVVLCGVSLKPGIRWHNRWKTGWGWEPLDGAFGSKIEDSRQREGVYEQSVCVDTRRDLSRPGQAGTCDSLHVHNLLICRTPHMAR